MDGKDSMEDRVDWLSVIESISDEAIVTRGSSGMQPQIRDWRCEDEPGESRGVGFVRIRTLCCYVELCLGGDLLEPRDARH